MHDIDAILGKMREAIPVDAHHELARRIAAGGIVLLKNEPA